MRVPGGFELTYCTNIHSANTWPKIFENLRAHAPVLKERLSDGGPFGLGLRLASDEAVELLSGEHMHGFAEFLKDRGLYVALLNGFPYGSFHDRPLKDQVFAPDWHTDERVEYTRHLCEVLSRILPSGLDGGVSTCPLSYKHWFTNGSQPDWTQLIRNIIRAVRVMWRYKQDLGIDLHLDIEPEPDGLIENTAEFIDFFGKLLRQGAPVLAKSAHISASEAEQALRQHVAVCYDICHFAVEGESPSNTVTALRRAGIRIGRAQVSSALMLDVPASSDDRKDVSDHLASLADPVYLHQVIGTKERYADLAEALPGLHSREVHSSEQWRIHYHVPLFLANYGVLRSTQADVRDALAFLTPSDTQHLEIETYTWGVLPPELKLDLTDSIEREYRWVLSQL